jgi:cellobiose phosphorylase
LTTHPLIAKLDPLQALSAGASMIESATTAPVAVKPETAHAVRVGGFGHFAPDGREFVITDFRTPRPWVNVIANPRFGLAVSQTGSGFTWIDNSQLAVITRWQQDLTRDEYGKFLFLRDDEVGRVWSLSPAPTWPAYDVFECRHGLGYSTFIAEYDTADCTCARIWNGAAA